MSALIESIILVALFPKYALAHTLVNLETPRSKSSRAMPTWMLDQRDACIDTWVSKDNTSDNGDVC